MAAQALIPADVTVFRNAGQGRSVTENRSNADMGIGDRIKKVREDLGLSVPALAKKVGLAASTLYDLEAGASKNTKRLHWVAEALGVRIEWLETGRGPIKAPTVERGPEVRGSVPLISWVAAGTWNNVEDPYAVGDAEDWLPCPKKHGPRTYCLRVRGQSMYNPGGKWSYEEGDVIFVDPDVRPRHLSRVIVRLEDRQETTFKQLIEEGPHQYLKALNPAWPEQIIEVTANATICGVVIGKWTDE